MTKVKQVTLLESASASAEEAGLRVVDPSEFSRRGSYDASVISSIHKGKAVNLRPSDKIVSEMRRRDWSQVKATWRVNERGEVKWLVLEPREGKEGVRIRYDYPNQRPHVHVGTNGVGRAVINRAVACDEKVNEDSIWFSVRASAGLLQWTKSAEVLK